MVASRRCAACYSIGQAVSAAAACKPQKPLPMHQCMANCHTYNTCKQEARGQQEASTLALHGISSQPLCVQPASPLVQKLNSNWCSQAGEGAEQATHHSPNVHAKTQTPHVHESRLKSNPHLSSKCKLDNAHGAAARHRHTAPPKKPRYEGEIEQM